MYLNAFSVRKIEQFIEVVKKRKMISHSIFFLLVIYKTENNYKVRPNKYKVSENTTNLIKNTNMMITRFVELIDQTKRIQRLDNVRYKRSTEV